VTWHAAYRIADEQVAYWQRSGVTAREAAIALQHDLPVTWVAVRRQLAAWAMLHQDRWEN